MNKKIQKPHSIVIVGGGASGLELASALGKKYRHKPAIEVTLIDASRTHVWKPLFHEVAAGSLDSSEEVAYLAQARWSGFRFRLGWVNGLNREKQEVYVGPTINEKGEEIIPKRAFHYDTLVIAVGSVSNSFGIAGVEDHCLFLDTAEQARKFQKHLLDACIQANFRDQRGDAKKLSIAIVGAGATGIELAAELHEVTRYLATYGLDAVIPDEDVQISIIEASERLLPALPENLSRATGKQLHRLNIQLRLGCRVTEVTEAGVKTGDGEFIPADIKVWAAGIKAPDWLNKLDGLESNKLNQLVVRQTLQTTRDDNIYAMGDCAACSWQDNGQNVPPRAQAAHQQAELICKSIKRRLGGKNLPEFRYKDYGSLVNLGKYSTVGNLMGNLMGSVTIGGLIARAIYLSLYKIHQIAIFGYFRTGMLMLANLFQRGTRSRVKLH